MKNYKLWLKGLDESIILWGRRVSGVKIYEDCPLCLIGKSLFSRCSECPIRLLTGRESCRGTSYYKWDDTPDGPDKTRQAKTMLQQLIDTRTWWIDTYGPPGLEVIIVAFKRALAYWKSLSTGDTPNTNYECSLCKIFHPKHHNDQNQVCEWRGVKCPVYEVTGQVRCGGTPYQVWYVCNRDKHYHTAQMYAEQMHNKLKEIYDLTFEAKINEIRNKVLENLESSAYLAMTSGLWPQRFPKPYSRLTRDLYLSPGKIKLPNSKGDNNMTQLKINTPKKHELKLIEHSDGSVSVAVTNSKGRTETLLYLTIQGKLTRATHVSPKFGFDLNSEGRIIIDE